MKNTIYFLSILLLFQSCYSYKAFDLKEYETVKPKKVKIELKDSKKFKGKIIKIERDTIILKNYISTKKISIPSITVVKKRKFSWLKTYLLSGAISSAVLMFILNALINGLGKTSLN